MDAAHTSHATTNGTEVERATVSGGSNSAGRSTATTNGTDFLARINAAIRKTDEAYDIAAKKVGLSQSSFDILYTLRSIGEGCSQKDLSQASCTGKQTINSAIHRLQRNGILRLESGFGRTTLVYLTDKGKKMVRTRIDPVISAETAAAKSLPAQDQDALAKAFEDYAQTICAHLDHVHVHKQDIT